MSLSVAIVGGGPAGFYAAEALLRKAPGTSIDIFDRLPTPYGLVRAGVAPDHQAIKNISRVFERTATKTGVRFLGHVEVGRDIGLHELHECYDAVVLAYGCAEDRRLGIPGEDKAGVYGSRAFVAWYNGHPDYRDLRPDFNARSIVVIGNGNVAIDVARVLGKTAGEMAASDIAVHARTAIDTAPIEAIHMVGRRGPLEASFTNAELSELGRLERCVALTDPADLPDRAAGGKDNGRGEKETNLAILHSFAANPPGSKAIDLRLHFYANPVAILGGERVKGVRFERTRVEAGRAVATGETFDLEAQLVVTCIGYRALPLAGAPFDKQRGMVANQNGRAGPGLYVVGWAKRGSSGTLAINRTDSIAVIDLLLADFGAAGGNKSGGKTIDILLGKRGVRPVSFEDWQKIDAAEVAAAQPGAPRGKFTSIEEMLVVAGGTPRP